MAATSNHAAFAARLRKLSPMVLRIADGVHKEVGFAVMTRAMEKSPVREGRLRSNWHITFGAPASKVDGVRSPSAAAAAARAALRAGAPLETLFLTNTMPYAEVVEFGGYPKSVKFGSYIPERMRDRISDNARVLARDAKGKPKRVQFSEGGYSRQAPSGMLRVSVEELSGAVDGIVRKVLADQGIDL